MSTNNTPIAIDCGSYTLRAGFGAGKKATDVAPSVVQRSISAHPRKSKVKRGLMEGGPIVGESALTADSSLYVLRDAFESNVVVNFEALEALYSHSFESLRIKGDSVSHPLVVTECPLNPAFTRKRNAELIFEGYGAESVCFGVDALFSYWNECTKRKSKNSLAQDSEGIVISLGDRNSHIIPILSGKMAHGSLRIPIGGQTMSEFLLKIAETDFPALKGHLSPQWAMQQLHDYAYVPEDYMEEIRHISEDREYAKSLVVRVPVGKTDTDADTGSKDGEMEMLVAAAATEAEAKKHDRAAQGRRLAKQGEMKRKRETEERDTRLDALKSLIAVRGQLFGSELNAQLRHFNVRSMRDAEKEVEYLEEEVEKARIRAASSKKKREQRTYRNLMRKAVIGAVLAAEKRGTIGTIPNREEISKSFVQVQSDIDREYSADPTSPTVSIESTGEKIQLDSAQVVKEAEELAKLRGRRIEILQIRLERGKHSRDREKNREKYKSQNLKSLTRVAFDLGDGEAQFGAKDEDWDMYLAIGTSATDVARNEEDEDLLKIERVVVGEYGMKMPELEDLEASMAENEANSTVNQGFGFGFGVGVGESTTTDAAGAAAAARNMIGTDGTSEQFKKDLVLCVARCRVPEILFQPHIMGLPNSGLMESLSHVLSRISTDIGASSVTAVSSNVHITGGVSNIQGIEERVASALRSIRPIDGPPPFVWKAEKPEYAAWEGAANWSRILSDKWGINLRDVSISKLRYDEEGERCLESDMMPVHPASNVL